VQRLRSKSIFKRSWKVVSGDLASDLANCL